MDLSQSHEKCDDNLARTPYMKSICIFWEVFINLNKHALLDTCASYLYILVGRKVMVAGRSLHICWKKYHKAVALKWKYFQIIK